MSETCERCGKPVKVVLWKRTASWPLIAVGIIFAIPTIGLSLVVTVYGVFLRRPECQCR